MIMASVGVMSAARSAMMVMMSSGARKSASRMSVISNILVKYVFPYVKRWCVLAVCLSAISLYTP